MLISLVSDKNALLSLYADHLLGITSHQTKLNKIARLNGFSKWGDITKILKSPKILHLDRRISAFNNAGASLSIFNINPLGYELIISDFITLTADKYERLDLLRVCNLFAICAFAGLHKQIQSDLPSYLNKIESASTCSLANLDVSEMSIEQYICNLNYLFTHGLKIVDYINDSELPTLTPTKAIWFALEGVNFVSRDINLTTRFALVYADSVKNDYMANITAIEGGDELELGLEAEFDPFKIIFNNHVLYDPELDNYFSSVVDYGPQDYYRSFATRRGRLVVMPSTNKVSNAELSALNAWRERNKDIIDFEEESEIIEFVRSRNEEALN